jgi:hypothetical protein
MTTINISIDLARPTHDGLPGKLGDVPLGASAFDRAVEQARLCCIRAPSRHDVAATGRRLARHASERLISAVLGRAPTDDHERARVFHALESGVNEAIQAASVNTLTGPVRGKKGR